MIARSLGIGALLVFLSAPALAFHCPADVKAIDHALEKANLGAEQEATAKALRDEGAALHEAGNHKEAVDKLSEAMRTILNSL